MTKKEYIQTGMNILWLLIYLVVVAICSAIIFWLELNQEHPISDTGIPSNFLDGIFSFFVTCLLLFVAVVFWMIRIGRNIRLEGMGRTYRITNRTLQWLPISVLMFMFSFLFYMVITRFY